MVPAAATAWKTLVALVFLLVQCLFFSDAFVAPQLGTVTRAASSPSSPSASTSATAIVSLRESPAKLLRVFRSGPAAGAARSTAAERRRRRLAPFEMVAGGADAAAAGKTKVLFVCLGNICRSPTAEAVFKQVTAKAGDGDKFEIDSCGTGGGSPDWYKSSGESYHEGDSPDARMTAAAAKRGVELGGGSRPLRPVDLEDFDLIVGMDSANTKAITLAAEHWGKSELAAAKTRTMTTYCRSSGDAKSVPDPYYGGPKGFETVLDLLDDACEGLLQKCLAGDA